MLKETSIWVCYVTIPWYQTSSIETNRDIVSPCVKRKNAIFSELKGGSQTPNNFYVWLLHSYQGHFAKCQHLLTIMCRYQTIWKLRTKVTCARVCHLTVPWYQPSPIVIHSVSMCQMKAAIFSQPKRVPQQCVRLNVSSLLLGMLLSFVNTHLLCVYMPNIHYNRIWFFIQQ
jgi:hypothetical protein